MTNATLPAAVGAKRNRIAIVDDHPITREGLRAVINREPDFMVWGEFEDGFQALAAFQKMAPDLVLLDLSMPGKSGLELIKDLKAMCPDILILAISMHDESLYAERVLRAGASGYINKHKPPEELIRAIRQVMNNQVYLSKEESERLLQRISGKARTNQSPMDILTDREFEIFQIIGDGKTPKEIAMQLNLSIRTVAVHYANIRQKLNLGGTSQLIRFAVQSASFETCRGN